MLNYQNKQNNKQMKNTLKSVLTLALVAGLGFVANAQLVTTANADATATATVLTDISITKDLDIAFGNVQTGTIPTLDATTFASSAFVGATAAIGKFTVQGTPTASVLVTFTALVTMENEDATDALDFTPTVVRTALTADLDGATNVPNNSAYVINNSAAGAIVGTDHFFIGGTLTEVGGGNIPADASGLYTGTFTLTVAYN
jgi:hypothetical protein